MRFFKPKPAFFDWIKQVVADQKKKMPVVDCGCGAGDLVMEMNKQGIPALGIDPRYTIYDEQVPFALIARLLSMHAEDCTFVTTSPSILLTCRPCHDGFPGRINQVRHPDSLQFYVGLSNNIEFDVSGAKTKLVLEDVGEEGENIWSLKRRTGEDDIDFRISLLNGKRRLGRTPSMSP